MVILKGSPVCGREALFLILSLEVRGLMVRVGISE